MGLFKSKEERRLERDIKIRQGIRRIEKAIAEQNKFADEFVKNARHAKEIGDMASYQFIRNSLKKTATIKKLLERQLLAVKNALLIKRQAEASADFAAAMSTVSTSLNSSATLIMTDYYKRLLRPRATEREAMRVLYAGTVVWGILGTATAFLLVNVQSALDAWWTLSSIFSGGILGLFLLGLISRRARNPAAVTAVTVGLLVIGWAVLSQSNWWPASLDFLRSPFHKFMVIVVGTLTILLVGLTVSAFTSARGGR